MRAPKYAVLGKNSQPGHEGTTMIREGKTYYRDNGHWEIGWKIKNGKVLAKSICNNTKHLDGLEFTEITEKEWAEENVGYDRLPCCPPPRKIK